MSDPVNQEGESAGASEERRTLEVQKESKEEDRKPKPGKLQKGLYRKSSRQTLRQRNSRKGRCLFSSVVTFKESPS